MASVSDTLQVYIALLLPGQLYPCHGRMGLESGDGILHDRYLPLDAWRYRNALASIS